MLNICVYTIDIILDGIYKVVGLANDIHFVNLKR